MGILKEDILLTNPNRLIWDRNTLEVLVEIEDAGNRSVTITRRDDLDYVDTRNKETIKQRVLTSKIKKVELASYQPNNYDKETGEINTRRVLVNRLNND